MFCKTVWNGLHILPDGYIRLCSLGTNSDPALDMQRCRDKDGNVMHILTHDIKDIMNSDKHREVRLLNVKNPTAWSPHCDCCENREIITNHDRLHLNKSRRIYLMKMDTDSVVNESNYSDFVDADGYSDVMPSSLDIRFGNLCNQKCIMCSPTFSNLWYDEHFEFNKTQSFGQGVKITVSKNMDTGKWITPPELQWFEDPRWWPKFEEMMPHLRHIYITGGEPMVTPAHDIMLDKLIKSGYAKNVWLEYDTNCSAVNDKIAKRWSSFSKVDIRGSMDGIESKYELIRFPGKWEKFTTNVKKLKEYETESDGRIKVLALTSCFQLSTIFGIIESEDWCKSVGTHFHMRFLEGPDYHSVSILPDFAKLELISYFEKYRSVNSKVDMIVKYLQNHMGPKYYKPEAIKKFVKFMDYLDTTRNTNWRQSIPETSELIDRCINLI